MKTEEVMALADTHAGLLSDRAYGYAVSDDAIEQSEANFRAALDRLTQAETLLVEMVKQRDAGFINEDGWLLCCHCGHMQENSRYDHFKTCTITRARELLGIEV